MAESPASPVLVGDKTEPPILAEEVRPQSWWRHVTYERVIDGIQAIVLVAGIIIAVYQSLKIREAIDTSTWGSLAAQLTEVDKQFVEHPELVPYFYEGKKIERSDNREYQLAYSLGVLVIDFMDSSIVMGKHIDPEIFEPDNWERFYEYQFRQSPLICDIIIDEADIYGNGIVERGKRICAAVAREQLAKSALPASATLKAVASPEIAPPVNPGK